MSLLYNQGGTRLGIAASAASIKAGQSVTFTAGLQASVPGSGAPTGTIAFKDGTKQIGSAQVVNGKATFTTASLNKGARAIAASYYGNASFNSHLSAPANVSVK
jgi:Bacterial Ig-like domain (group 3)